MTKRTGVESLLSGHPACVPDIDAPFFFGMGGVKGDMRRARPMTSLTIDAKQDLSLVKEIPRRVLAGKDRLCMGGMTFQALRGNRPVVDGCIRCVAGFRTLEIGRAHV